MSSSTQAALRAAAAPITARLKLLGFRKLGNYYNRVASDRLVQVVGLQSGQAVSIQHGTFTVNLGVYVPCMATIEGNLARGSAVADSYCEIRSRLSDIAGLGIDRWWPLDDSAAAIGSTLAQAIEEHGIRFLEMYGSYAQIIERFEVDGSLPFDNPGRSALVVAVIQWARGEKQEARRYFELARRTKTNNPRFADHVVKIQARLEHQA